MPGAVGLCGGRALLVNRTPPGWFWKPGFTNIDSISACGWHQEVVGSSRPLRAAVLGRVLDMVFALRVLYHPSATTT